MEKIEKTGMIDNKLSSVTMLKGSSVIIDYNDYRVPIDTRDLYLSKGDFQVKGHWHDEIELLHVKRGSMRVVIGQKEYYLMEGDCFYVSPRTVHNWTTGYDPYCHLTLAVFRKSLITEDHIARNMLIEKLIGRSNIKCIHIRAKQEYSARLAECIDNIAECRDDIAGNILYVAGNIHMALDVLCKSVAGTGTADEKTDKPDMTCLQQMISFVRSNYMHKISIDDIAATAGVSRSKCYRMFNRYTGQSPGNFINDYRLEKSCIYLAKTGMPVADIAHECGFSQVSYFDRVFAAKYGQTPLKYRQKARQKA